MPRRFPPQRDGALVGHSHYNDASLFIDISATGIPLGMTEDGETTVTTTVGNAAFPSGLTTIGNNGVVASGPDVFISFVNSSLPNFQFDAALVPFWTDLGVANGDVYYEERLVDGINTLIVQWDDIPHLQAPGTVTFQLQLSIQLVLISLMNLPRLFSIYQEKRCL